MRSFFPSLLFAAIAAGTPAADFAMSLHSQRAGIENSFLQHELMIDLVNTSKRTISLFEMACSYYDSFGTSEQDAFRLSPWPCDANFVTLVKTSPGDTARYKLLLARRDSTASSRTVILSYAPTYAVRKNGDWKAIHGDLIWSDTIQIDSTDNPHDLEFSSWTFPMVVPLKKSMRTK